MVVVPTFPSLPLYTEQVELDGRAYVLWFDWNGRAGRWFLSIATVDGEPLLSGLMLVCGAALLRRTHHDLRLPSGELVVMSTTPDDSPPGYTDIGTRAILYYIPAEEL